MSREARFEIVRTDAGGQARFVDADGDIVWTTKFYPRPSGAVDAIASICGTSISFSPFADYPEIARGPFRIVTEVRDFDERGQS